MPYIKQEIRSKLDSAVDILIDSVKDLNDLDGLDGNLNYCFTKICKRLYPAKYHWYNRMIGMFECCKLELSRRLVAPYEDEKIIENGDVE